MFRLLPPTNGAEPNPTPYTPGCGWLNTFLASKRISAYIRITAVLHRGCTRTAAADSVPGAVDPAEELGLAGPPPRLAQQAVARMGAQQRRVRERRPSLPSRRCIASHPEGKSSGDPCLRLVPS